MKNNKGITLIALVITIIVMLILVGVTIRMAVNGGLFDYAGKAVGDTKNAIKVEQKLADGRIKMGNKWYASVEDYLNNNPIPIGIRISPAEVTLTKNESDEVVLEQKLTEEITATPFGMETEPEITWGVSPENQTAIELSSTTGKTITITAVGTEDSEVTLTAKCTYEGTEYPSERKVKLEIQEKPAITAATMTTNLADYLGETINYEVEYDDKSSYGNKEWEIFYSDGKHIYIITRGYLHTGGRLITTGYTGTSDFTAKNLQSKYKAVAAGLLNKIYDPTAAGTDEDPYLKISESSDYNIKATQYLLDSTVELWSNLVNNEYADWAIGGPTLELFVNSYNAYYPNKTTTIEYYSSTGIPRVTPQPDLNQNTYLLHYPNPQAASEYWLAYPYCNGSYHVLKAKGLGYGISSSHAQTASEYFRPIVCLLSDVQISWDEATSAYNISSVKK